MTADKLTRQELSWLLAQEARGAARKLREGVAQLTQPPAASDVEIRTAPVVETSLDALDEAITRLGELQVGSQAKLRRGRIDLASLLCEVAPNARIAMEPGAGTEVSGEETELRRMLHLLVSQTNSTLADSESARPEVTIKREGEWVRISVELGPDSSATAELERRWLSRMATRHGGRLELERGTESLLVPADRSAHEVAELRKELVQAQQLGEAYARELAAVFTSTELPPEPRASSQPPSPGADRLEPLVAAANVLVRMLRGWLEAARTDASLAGEALGAESELAQRLTKRASASQELASELGRIGDCPSSETPAVLDVAELLRAVASSSEQRAARHGISISLVVPDSLERTVRPTTLELVARCLIDHAIAATPHGGQVRVRASGRGSGFEIGVDDGGPVVPAASRPQLLRRQLDPSSLGRPDGLSLLVAETAAPILGGSLSLNETPEGRSEVVLDV